ncbi:MAG: hypothetical protein LQ348_007233 [Seirophora lacunosa]|nr:MAG: hypothetical protein LQ348_007233 [Seirophora lacunosa]
MLRRFLRDIRRRLRRVPRSTTTQQPQDVVPPITITPEHQNIQQYLAEQPESLDDYEPTTTIWFEVILMRYEMEEDEDDY